MSRTYRKVQRGERSCYYRRPKTTNERKALTGLLQDNNTEDYQISGLNHLQRRLSHCVTAWDDIVISGYYEMDHTK